MQVKGKAAIDVVCNPLGKSGGALIQQFLILSFGSLSNSTPYLGGILLVIVLAWLAAARSLDRQFTPLAKKNLKEKLIEVKSSPVKSTSGDNKFQTKQGVRYRFVSTLNSKGFIEGKYVPVVQEESSNGNITVKKIDTEGETELSVGSTIVTEATVGEEERNDMESRAGRELPNDKNGSLN